MINDLNKRLLILDDDEDLIDIYKATFDGDPSGFQLSSATSGEDALAKIAEARASGAPFCAGFFDVQLGRGINGIETIRRAKEIDSQLLCTIVSGALDKSVEEIHETFGAQFSDRWDFLAKPFTDTEILQKAYRMVADWNRRARESHYLKVIQEQQARLVETEKLAAIANMGRGIGQEFAHVLNDIIGGAYAGMSVVEPHEREEAFRKIVIFAEEAKVGVKNLQSLLGGESSRQNVSLPDLIQEVLSLVEGERHRARVSLKLELAKNLPPLALRRDEMHQALWNIVRNAIQSMERNGGDLRISAKQVDSAILVDIQDQGCGIPAAVLPHIFDPLFSTRGGRGAGIGLTVAKRIVEGHGGNLDVKTQVYQGSSFTLRIPL